MVDVNNVGKSMDQLVDIDSKITIRLVKEKKSMTSYIYGLDKFMNVEKIKDFRIKLQAKLGTRSVERELQENKKTYKVYGFGGDHRHKIKDYLMDAEIDDEKIDIKM